jgi:hypothetical protein
VARGRQLERPGMGVGDQEAIRDRVPKEHPAEREGEDKGRPRGPEG